MAGAPSSLARIRKVMALLESDQAGEVRAAGRALQRLLAADPAALAPAAPAPTGEPCELEACLGYAAHAIAELTREIEDLRRDNARLRAQAAPAAWWPGRGRPPCGRRRSAAH